jgi:hypothetical protein
MTENVKQNIEAKVGRAIEKKWREVEKTDAKQLAELSRQAVQLKKIIRKVIEEPSRDNKITSEEWQEVFTKLCLEDKTLVEYFGIHDVIDLKIFIGIEEKLDETAIEAIARKIIEDDTNSEKMVFFEKTIKVLSKEDAGEVLYILAYAGKLDFAEVLLCNDKIKDSSKYRLILSFAAKNGGTAAVYRYGEWKNKIAGSFDLLQVAIRNFESSNPEGEVNNLYANQLVSSEQHQILLNVVSERKKMESVAKILIGEVPDEYVFIRNFLRDPALTHLGDFDPNWISSSVTINNKNFYINEKILPSFCVAVVRNLYFKNIELTEENVKKEVERILLLREQYKSISLFEGRNVLFMAHNEWVSGASGIVPRFGTNATIEAIKKQSKSVEYKKAHVALSSEDKLKPLREMKGEILKKIEITPPPFTFVFDGHGGEDAIYMDSGSITTRGQSPSETESSIRITVDEFAEAFNKRYQKYPAITNATAANRDILIFSSCFNHSFVRKFYELLPADVGKPITIGTAEYGQYSHSNYESRFGNNFFEHTLGLWRASPTRFQEVFWGDINQGIDNPYVYIPDETTDTGFMQVAKTEMESGGAVIA